jgi:ribosomal protein S18 acetylase RimI-like enzyme
VVSLRALDNPIWQALTSTQAHFAAGDGLARKFPAEVSILGAFSEPIPAAYDSLAHLLAPGECVGLFLHAPPEPSARWAVVSVVPLQQMVHQNANHRISEGVTQLPPFEELGAADVPAIMNLTQLTKPGPFSPRTIEMGSYFGLRIAGQLVAMAGERLSFPGHKEISAVCTHPNHLGRGYASALITALTERITRRGEVPFLHVRPENPAVSLYARLGFTKTVLLQYAVLRRNG